MNAAIVEGTIFFVLGAVIGSFLNVCVGRWPIGESIVTPRSRCPRCGRPIRWRENIPILGWLLLGGRCRGCRLPISIQYPIVELAVAIVWLAAALHFGAGFTALRVAVFATVLLGVAITDARHFLIPDGFTVFGFLFALATAVVAAVIGESSPFAGPGASVVGACAGAGAIAIVGWLGEVTLKREAMGFGDVTLMAMVGAALGPERALATVFVGALLGAVGTLLVLYPIAQLRGDGEPQLELGLSRPRRELPLVPFGVFLAPAAMLTLLWGSRVAEWYVARFLVA